MLDNNKSLFELHQELHDRRENKDEGALLFTLADLSREGLHDLRALQKSAYVYRVTSSLLAPKSLAHLAKPINKQITLPKTTMMRLPYRYVY